MNQQNKKISEKEAVKLLKAGEKNEKVKVIQETYSKVSQKQDNVWIISDSSSSFSNLDY